MKLKVLSASDCEEVRLWRNDCLQALRTPYPQTHEQQWHFYMDIVCHPETSKSLYRGVFTEINKDGETIDLLIGMVGLENIERQNSRAEISIMIKPEYRAAGYGEMALDELLKWGFNTENLENIWGECYYVNMAMDFWNRMVAKYVGFESRMEKTKFWNGEYWDSMMFNFNRERWMLCHK